MKKKEKKDFFDQLEHWLNEPVGSRIDDTTYEVREFAAGGGFTITDTYNSKAAALEVAEHGNKCPYEQAHGRSYTTITVYKNGEAVETIYYV